MGPNLLHCEVVLQTKACPCHCPVGHLTQQRDNGNEAIANRCSQLEERDGPNKHNLHSSKEKVYIHTVE